MKLTTIKLHTLELEHDEFLAIRNVLVRALSGGLSGLDDVTQDILNDFIDTAQSGIM